MKQVWQIMKRYGPWLLLLLGVDGFAALLLWLADSQAFWSLVGVISLWSLILFAAVLLVVVWKEQKKQRCFQAFLSCPDGVNAEKLLRAVSGQEREQLKLLAAVMEEKQLQIREQREEIRDYEEYVEGWAHEAKTPLSLLTMILDNHQMSHQLQTRLDYVRSQLQEDITQMLYYARLKSSTKDYRFTDVHLQEALQEVLEDYGPLLTEKQFVIQSDLKEERVFTDLRGLQFMLGQILSNAIKYSGDDPVLRVSLTRTETADVLQIGDNGVGVKSYDLPYLFQKGFTGDATDSQKKATGMGLYLTKKMADDLNVTLEVASQFGKGLTVSMAFPRVEREEI